MFEFFLELKKKVKHVYISHGSPGNGRANPDFPAIVTATSHQSPPHLHHLRPSLTLLPLVYLWGLTLLIYPQIGTSMTSNNLAKARLLLFNIVLA